jgi:hypothetical protein
MSTISKMGRMALSTVTAAFLGTLFAAGAPAVEAQQMRSGQAMGQGVWNDPLELALEHREALALTGEQIGFIELLHVASLERTGDAREIVMTLRDEMQEHAERMRETRGEMLQRRGERMGERGERTQDQEEMQERRREMMRERGEMMERRGEMMQERGAMMSERMDDNTRAAIQTLRTEYANNLAELSERLEPEQMAQLRRLTRSAAGVQAAQRPGMRMMAPRSGMSPGPQGRPGARHHR